ncbi:hypothetical protein M3Y98_00820800 [Aphelenchoides besseyi]|nr:hypothetical protein M3Y98_00820800 [Aphelenchoides besseyi]KAI6212217.1 hypothetical protein M3Y96_00517000 [Aphelenchoides besseyi]
MRRRFLRLLALLTLLATLIGTVHLQTIVQLQIQNKASVVRDTNRQTMSAEERHERLLKVRQKDVHNSTRHIHKPAKLFKPILTHVSEALILNEPSKSREQTPLSPTIELPPPKSTVRTKRPKLPTQHRKPSIVSGGTNQNALPPSRLYLLDKNRPTVKLPTDQTRTTKKPAFVHVNIPKQVEGQVENHYGLRSRVIVDVDEEEDASGFNALEELDSRIVPFEPRNRHWHLKLIEKPYRSSFDKPRAKVVVDNRRVLHRGENEI